MEFLFNLVLMLVIFFLLYVIYILLYSMIFGAPYAATREQKMNEMLDMLKLKRNDLFVDLGSGDGRIVIAAAKKGAVAHGYEMNPILVLISRRKIKKEGLSGKAKIFWKSYWNTNLNQYTAISVFGIKHIMPSLNRKFKKELNAGTRIVSNHFRLPKWKEIDKKGNLYLYRK